MNKGVAESAFRNWPIILVVTILVAIYQDCSTSEKKYVAPKFNSDIELTPAVNDSGQIVNIGDAAKYVKFEGVEPSDEKCNLYNVRYTLRPNAPYKSHAELSAVIEQIAKAFHAEMQEESNADCPYRVMTVGHLYQNEGDLFNKLQLASCSITPQGIHVAVNTANASRYNYNVK